jgi:hypothetical protein
MNSTEFFRRAHDDPAFRRKQLGDQRYYKNVNLGLFVLALAIGTYLTVSSGIRGDGWMEGLGIGLPLIMLTGCMHEVHRTRIAALKAIETRTPKGQVEARDGPPVLS